MYVSTLLEILQRAELAGARQGQGVVSTLLEILLAGERVW